MNSIWRRRRSCVAAITTPAPRLRPERSWLARPSTSSGPDGAPSPKPALDLVARARRELARLQERVDEEPQARLRRQPPGAGVRRGEEAERLQVRHHVADRGRRELHRQHLRQVARADRHAGLQIGVDDVPEHRAGALVEVDGAKAQGRAGGLWPCRQVVRAMRVRCRRQAAMRPVSRETRNCAVQPPISARRPSIPAAARLPSSRHQVPCSVISTAAHCLLLLPLPALSCHPGRSEERDRPGQAASARPSQQDWRQDWPDDWPSRLAR